MRSSDHERHPISRFDVPDLDDLPDDIRETDPRRPGEGRIRPERVPRLRQPTEGVPGILRVPRRVDGLRRGVVESRARADRRRDVGVEPVPLLRGRPRCDPADPGEEPAARRPGGDQPRQGRPDRTPAPHRRLRAARSPTTRPTSPTTTSTTCAPRASPTTRSGTSVRSRRCSPSRTVTPTSPASDPTTSSTRWAAESIVRRRREPARSRTRGCGPTYWWV